MGVCTDILSSHSLFRCIPGFKGADRLEAAELMKSELNCILPKLEICFELFSAGIFVMFLWSW